MAKAAVIDKNTCIGCSLCVAIAPGSFKLGEDGKAEAINPPGDEEEKLREAVDSCPVSAITLSQAE